MGLPAFFPSARIGSLSLWKVTSESTPGLCVGRQPHKEKRKKLRENVVQKRIDTTGLLYDYFNAQIFVVASESGTRKLQRNVKPKASCFVHTGTNLVASFRVIEHARAFN